MGHDVVDRTVLRLLKAKGYSLQANQKTREGAQHPDRDAQFRYINDTVAEALAAGEPVISVDAKKRELIGDFKAVGREFEPKGKPVEVRGHDFGTRTSGTLSPTASATSPPTRDGSASGSPQTPRSSAVSRSAAGGSTSAKSATPTRRR